MAERIAHFDPVNGAAGDMMLAALVDAGAPLDEIRTALSSLSVPAFELRAEEIRSQGLRGLRVLVDVPEETTHRHLPDVEAVVRGGALPASVCDGAMRVFGRLAEAEARAHGIPVEKVHFHEVGALDSILDIAGVVLALELLGVTRVTFSSLRVGTGEIRTAHGVLPVPVPAVAELIRGVPVIRTDIPGEILTPTGAALLTTLGEPVGPEEFVAEAVGVGCGTRELRDRPNSLRVTLGREASAAAAGGGAADGERADGTRWDRDEVVMLETNLDDLSPEILPRVIERALAAGALDAFVTPVMMKKGRAGHLLSVLAAPEAIADLTALLFAETSTFGVRQRPATRWKLPREAGEIDSPWGPIRVKIGDLGGGRRRITPEYESCREVADRTGIPLLEVYQEVEKRIRLDE